MLSHIPALSQIQEELVFQAVHLSHVAVMEWQLPSSLRVELETSLPFLYDTELRI